MGFSLKLGRVFGIDVFVHWTFVAIPIFVVVSSRMNNLSWMGVLFQLTFVLAAFGCILLHEFGHALSARAFGVGTKDIILTPIGGLARLERMPKHPVQEFIIAVAGPAVNVVIAFLKSPVPPLNVALTPITCDNGINIAVSLDTGYGFRKELLNPTLIAPR